MNIYRLLKIGKVMLELLIQCLNLSLQYLASKEDFSVFAKCSHMILTIYSVEKVCNSSKVHSLSHSQLTKKNFFDCLKMREFIKMLTKKIDIQN